jgi:hypothetical protein
MDELPPVSSLIVDVECEPCAAAMTGGAEGPKNYTPFLIGFAILVILLLVYYIRTDSFHSGQHVLDSATEPAWETNMKCSTSAN